jgi:adenosine deaminase
MHSLARVSGVLLIAAMAAAAGAQSASPGEQRAEHALAVAKKQGAPELYALLREMPKGADLHMHLSGAVYAESFIREAAEAGLCVSSVDKGTPAVPIGQDAVQFVAPGKKGCAAGQVSAADAMKRQPLYDDLVDSLSMRAFVPTQGINGHDQFFATFDRVGELDAYGGEWLDEVATRAAAQNELYLEIMKTPPFSHAAAIASRLGWPADAATHVSRAELAKLRDELLAAGLRDEVAEGSKQIDAMQASRRSIEHCDATPRNPACDVETRFLYQVLRGFAPQQVFAQTLLGFEQASADPRWVGINFVMPEDGYVSMRDYHLQMEMLDYLHSVYPKVHISLHAGELAPGLVPPDGLRFHIREAVELGHAERIGHGVDVLYEDRPQELMKEMAAKHVMVEVNLTSNDVILGVKGTDHPLAAYRAAKVPMALSTDDEGVSRIDLTHEYVKGVMAQGLDYAELKKMSRASLEHSFLSGASLWQSEDDFTHRVGACAAAITREPAAGTCATFLQNSRKAAEEYELERRFVVFEAK